MQGKLSKISRSTLAPSVMRVQLCTEPNSLRSTFNDPSNQSEVVIDKTTWAMSRLGVVKLGDVMFRFFLQMS